MRKFLIFKKLRSAMRHTSPADLFLFLFMVLLMGQSAHILLFHTPTGSDISSIDIIVRTTAAAIFGYFISGGFLHPGRDEQSYQQQRDAAEPEKLSIQSNEEHSEHRLSTIQSRRKRQQVIIVGYVGLISLIVLIIARNDSVLSPAAISTISQLRDFVSGSVGLLIGHSTRDNS